MWRSGCINYVTIWTLMLIRSMSHYSCKVILIFCACPKVWLHKLIFMLSWISKKLQKLMLITCFSPFIQFWWWSDMKHKSLVMFLLLLHLVFFQSLVVLFFRLFVSMSVCVRLSVCQKVHSSSFMHDHVYISVGMADALIVSVCESMKCFAHQRLCAQRSDF